MRGGGDCALTGDVVNATPMVANTCYSFIDDKNVVHVASVHRYDAAQKTMVTVAGLVVCRPMPIAPKASSPTAGRATSGLTCSPERNNCPCCPRTLCPGFLLRICLHDFLCGDAPAAGATGSVR